MKICVSAMSGSLDAQVEPRFGRSPYFLIVDSESLESVTISNVATNALGGAGIQAAQTIAGKGAEVLITGSVGPNAFQALSSAGIKVVTGGSGTVREAVEKYKKGELVETKGPTVSGHFGMGGRFGRS